MKGQTLFSVRKSLLTFETAQFVPNLFLANLAVSLVPDVTIDVELLIRVAAAAHHRAGFLL